MTPREISIRMSGARKRLIREHNDRVYQAYTNAYLQRVEAKRFPKLEKLLYSDKEKKRQSWQKQLEIAKQWHRLFELKDKAKVKPKKVKK